MAEDKFFTVVFKGDVEALRFNLLTFRTPYGQAVEVAAYDALVELNKLEESIDGDYRGENDPPFVLHPRRPQ